MSDSDFPPSSAADIVSHMNEDHADAVLAIVRAYGRGPEVGSAAARDATEARLVAITPRALDIEFAVGDASARTTVAFDPPIDPLDTVRARLVTMTKAAREKLAGT